MIALELSATLALRTDRTNEELVDTASSATLILRKPAAMVAFETVELIETVRLSVLADIELLTAMELDAMESVTFESVAFRRPEVVFVTVEFSNRETEKMVLFTTVLPLMNDKLSESSETFDDETVEFAIVVRLLMDLKTELFEILETDRILWFRIEPVAEMLFNVWLSITEPFVNTLTRLLLIASVWSMIE